MSYGEEKGIPNPSDSATAGSGILHLLLLTHSQANARLIQQYLKDGATAAVQIAWARTLTTAVEVLAKQDFDIALVGLTLSDCPGASPPLALAEAAPILPIIALGEADDEQGGADLIRAGIQDFIPLNECSPTLLRRSICHAMIRKQTLLSGNEAQLPFRELAEYAPDAVIRVDSQKNLIYANPVARDWLQLGSRPAPIPLHQLHADAGVIHALNQSVDAIWGGENAWQQTTELTRADAAAILDWRWVPETDSTGNILRVMGVARDMTARRQREDAQRMDERMQAIGRLAGGVAHDFNNQLSPIMGYAQLLKKAVTDQPKIERYADTIIDAAKRSAELVSQLMTFARQGKIELHPISIHHVIEEALNFLERSLGKNIKLMTDFQADPDTILGDKGQLHSALVNIALNARDAMPEGGELTVHTGICEVDRESCQRLHLEHGPGRYLNIDIADTGTGMEPELIQHVFEPFFSTRKHPREGSGLGLASVYGVIQQHDGGIGIDSIPGTGTTVRLFLPLQPQQTNPEHSSRLGPMVHGSGHILVVDDEAHVAELAADILQILGYTVSICRDGKEGLDQYRREWRHIDLVLLDMIMPEMSGKEAFYAMKIINPEIKAILATGYAIDQDVQEVMQQGIQALIRKPFRVDELSQTISQLLKKDRSDTE